jgi:hypothetical protein
MSKRFLLAGDVGLKVSDDYMMHDGVHFTITEEDDFLDNSFTGAYRYDRIAQTTTSEEEEVWLGNLRAQLAMISVSTDPLSAFDSWCKVTSSDAVDSGDRIDVTARVQIQEDSEISPSVSIFWAQSLNREFNDDGQTPWTKTQMTLSADGSYTGSFDVDKLIPGKEIPEIAWYVQVEESVLAPDGQRHPRRDATPIRLLREQLPLTCTDFTRACGM